MAGLFTYTVNDGKGETDTATVSGAKNVSPTSSVSAVFSERMDANALRDPVTEKSTTFVLKRGTVEVPATVKYNADTLTATLLPGSMLRRGATYTATVTTGAKDETGTPLDQDPNTAGNQGKVWSFKIRR